MGKVITSPVKRWPGTVTISDPLTYPQALALDESLAAAKAVQEPTVRRYHAALLPGLCECVEAWNLERLPEKLTAANFPASPRESSARLITWLLEAVVDLYDEDPAVPKV